MLISQLFGRSPASVVFDKYPECVPSVSSCYWLYGLFRYFVWLCLFDIPTAYFKIFRLFNFLYAYLLLFNTRREITVLDEVLVCMTLHCRCTVSLYLSVQFCYGNAWNKKRYPVVDLWSLLMRLNAGSSGIVVWHLYPDLTPLVVSVHTRFIWCPGFVEQCTSAVRYKAARGDIFLQEVQSG
jgi:hypothetical protein